jgi:hypothetical protein
MVMRIILFITLLPLLGFSQDDSESVVRSGLLRSQATITYGKFTAVNQSSLYIQGNLEYYVNSKLSTRGDLFYFLKPNDESLLEINNQLFAGGSFHIPYKGNFNPYLGIQPGIAITESSNTVIPNIYKPNAALTPLISGVIGFNYYAKKWFHLFVDGRYVLGKHLSNYPPVDISEFRISFGLGFNINTK